MLPSAEWNVALRVNIRKKILSQEPEASVWAILPTQAIHAAAVVGSWTIPELLCEHKLVPLFDRRVWHWILMHTSLTLKPHFLEQT